MAKIVGHRGAAGLALENTIASIKAARKYDVDAVEFDVRFTKDKHVVLSHDRHLARVSVNTNRLADLDLSEVLKVTLHEEHRVSTLKDAIKACDDTPMVIEIKEPGMAQAVLDVIKPYKNHITVTSLWHNELRTVRKLRPDIPVLVRDQLSPFEIIATARRMGAVGINLNVWLMNPLTYWLAKRNGLTVMVYTVNHTLLARFLHRFYPDIMVCTNRPDKFVRKRPFKALAKKLQSKNKHRSHTPHAN